MDYKNWKRKTNKWKRIKLDVSALLCLFCFVHYWYTGCWKTIPNGKHSRAYASRTLSALSGPERIGKSAHGLQGSPRWQVQTRYMSELGDNILLSFPFFFFLCKSFTSGTHLAVLYLLAFTVTTWRRKKRKKTARPSVMLLPPKDCRLYVTTTVKHSRVLWKTFKKEKIKQVNYKDKCSIYNSTLKSTEGKYVHDKMVVNIPQLTLWDSCI